MIYFKTGGGETMELEYTQFLCNKVTRYRERLEIAWYNSYHYILKQFFHFLNDNNVFKTIIEELTYNYRDLKEKALSLTDKKYSNKFPNPKEWTRESENENAAFIYFVIECCAE